MAQIPLLHRGAVIIAIFYKKGTVDVIEPTLFKRPKILPLEKPDLETGKD